VEKSRTRSALEDTRVAGHQGSGQTPWIDSHRSDGGTTLAGIYLLLIVPQDLLSCAILSPIEDILQTHTHRLETAS
jgi:hypothetical protein